MSDQQNQADLNEIEDIHRAVRTSFLSGSVNTKIITLENALMDSDLHSNYVMSSLDGELLDFLYNTAKANKTYLIEFPTLIDSLTAVITNFLISTLNNDALLKYDPKLKNDFGIFSLAIKALKPTPELNFDSFLQIGSCGEFNLPETQISTTQEFETELNKMYEHFSQDISGDMCAIFTGIIDSIKQEYLVRRYMQYTDLEKYLNLLDRTIRSLNQFFATFMPFIKLLYIFPKGDQAGRELFQRIDLNSFGRIHSQEEA